MVLVQFNKDRKETLKRYFYSHSYYYYPAFLMSRITSFARPSVSPPMPYQLLTRKQNGTKP